MTAASAQPGALRTGTMPAWRQHRYGGPGVVALERADVPAPGRGEVLVRLRATGLNSGDVRILRGEPIVVRAAFGLRRPKQPVRGMDAAATVVALGEGVDSLAVGDEVVGELPAGGGLAQFAVAPASRFVRRPSALDAVLAATLPVAGGTAWQALERGGVEPGHRVLVIGASGGVGTFAVQLAALRGADVHALCGERSRTLVAGLGASKTWDYRLTRASDLPPETYDVVIDIAGTAPLRALQRLVRGEGRVVMVSGEGGRVWGPIGRIAAASVVSMLSTRKAVMLAAVAKPDVLAQLVTLAADGRLRPVVERTFVFAEAASALAHVDAGHTVGKVVVVAD